MHDTYVTLATPVSTDGQHTIRDRTSEGNTTYILSWNSNHIQAGSQLDNHGCITWKFKHAFRISNKTSSNWHQKPSQERTANCSTHACTHQVVLHTAYIKCSTKGLCHNVTQTVISLKCDGQMLSQSISSVMSHFSISSDSCSDFVMVTLLPSVPFLHDGAEKFLH